MYDIPDREDVEKVVIDKSNVEAGKKPKLVVKSSKTSGDKKPKKKAKKT
jgi:ATP-dependent protease Clp ATPase subunit